MPQQETEGAPLTAEDDEPQWDHVGVSQPLLLLLFPPADSRTVTAASARPGIYASVLAADMQTPAPPLQACGASWPRCDEHVKPCGAAGERSINPHVPGPFHPSCTSFCSVLLIRRLERKTSGSVNSGWKLCSLTHSLKVCFKGPIAPLIYRTYTRAVQGTLIWPALIFHRDKVFTVAVSSRSQTRRTVDVISVSISFYWKSAGRERIWCVLGGC